MPAGFPKSPLLLKGALIQLNSSLVGPVPNVVPFQYNPETLSRKLEPWQPEQPKDAEGGQTAGQVQPYDPQETIELALTQRYQRFEGQARHGGANANIVDGRLQGERIRFSFVDSGGVKHEFAGRVVGDRIEGTTRLQTGASVPFTATRKRGA